MGEHNGYHRCEYPPDLNGGRECDNWFKSDEGQLCILHREITSPALVDVSEDSKSEYIRLRNAQVEEVSKMTLDQIDEHIARIEKVIENERTKLLAARAVRSGKLQDLSDEERAERKKIKYEITSSGVAKKQTKQEKLKATIKNDPVQYFMDSLGFTRENAEAFCTAQGISFVKVSE